MTKKLMVLLMKNVVKTPKVKFISIILDIVNLIITDKEQRKLILDSILKEEESSSYMDDDATPYTYRKLLKQVET